MWPPQGSGDNSVRVRLELPSGCGLAAEAEAWLRRAGVCLGSGVGKRLLEATQAGHDGCRQGARPLLTAAPPSPEQRSSRSVSSRRLEAC